MSLSDTIIAFHFQNKVSDQHAQLLVESLNRFSGRYKYFLRWGFDLSKPTHEIESFDNKAQFFTPQIPEEIRNFPLAAKIFAAAEAEELAVRDNSPLLVWLDPDNLFFHEPLDLILQPQEMIALSPVHLANISSDASQPLDDYWKTIFEQCGVAEENVITLTSIADQKKIRAHFNAGLLAVNPNRGILRKWKENFLVLWKNPVIESFYEKDRRYRLYIHQAALAGTVLATCETQEIRMLPPTYNFPLHLLNTMDQSLKPRYLNQLTNIRYESVDEMNFLDTLSSEEPIKSWLIEVNKRLRQP